MEPLNNWQQERLSYIKGLKSPTDHQRLLILLTEKEIQDPRDEKKLRALWKAEKTADQLQKSEIKVQRLLREEQDVERKARNKRLHDAFGLLVLAGICDGKTAELSVDPAILVGCFMDLKNGLDHPDSLETIKQWKMAGEQILNRA